MTRSFASVTATALAFAPEAARACAVCGAGTGEDPSRVAYLLTTLALSALPLGALGGLALWLRHLHRQRTRDSLHPPSL